MESFKSDWLALREPFDAEARSRPLARAFLGAIRRNGRVADLGSGRGANVRYLASLGRRDLRWLLVDGDRHLLAQAKRRARGVETLCADLARPRTLTALRGCDGVTMSALCDLVSGAWIERLVRQVSRARLPVLAALSVDGRVNLAPAMAGDGAVLTDFRKDQRRDKGFGPALGGCAPTILARALLRHGYRVRRARSDWRLAGSDDALLRPLVDGIASVDPAHRDRWLSERRDQIAGGRISASVGHIDVLGLPRRFTE